MPSTPDPEGLDHAALRDVLGYHLSLANVPGRELFDRYIGGPCKLRPVEYALMVLVISNQDVSQKQLGQALALPAPNLTLLLDRLVERGLLLRERSAADRRMQHVRLTEAGQALVQQAHAAVPAMEREWLQVLTEGEKAILLELLRKITRQQRRA